MEIDETFTSLEEIQSLLERDGMTWRISVDEDEIEEPEEENEEGEGGDKEVCRSKIVLESASFSAEADAVEIEKWEAELPDIDEKEEKETPEMFEEKQSTDEIQKTAFENASVIYFDLFKKKTYTKTLIFQTEEENKTKIYRLIGFCEAPMS